MRERSGLVQHCEHEVETRSCSGAHLVLQRRHDDLNAEAKEGGTDARPRMRESRIRASHLHKDDERCLQRLPLL